MELWDLYTKDRQLTGKTMVRGEPRPEGYYTLGVYVWVRNKAGEYLISQRSGEKPSYPLCWETVGGCVLAGETSFNGAVREVKEEVGIEVNPERLEFIYSVVDWPWNGRKPHMFNDVYLYRMEEAFNTENAVSDEVVRCRWMTSEEVRSCFREGTFIDVLEQIFEKIDREN